MSTGNTNPTQRGANIPISYVISNVPIEFFLKLPFFQKYWLMPKKNAEKGYT